MFSLNYGRVFRLAVLCTALAPLSCGALISQKSDDDSQTLAAALAAAALLGQSCTLGGVTFTAGSGVTCANGTASGTGTLTASTNNAHEQVVQFSSTIQSGGKVDYVSEASSSALTDGAFIRLSTGGNSASSPNRSASKTFNTAFAAPSAGVSETYCLQIHIHSGNAESYALKTSCPTNAMSGAAGDSCSASFFNWQATTCTGASGSTAGGTGAGQKWGFVLQNAAITSVSIPASARFN